MKKILLLTLSIVLLGILSTPKLHAQEDAAFAQVVDQAVNLVSAWVVYFSLPDSLQKDDKWKKEGLSADTIQSWIPKKDSKTLAVYKEIQGIKDKKLPDKGRGSLFYYLAQTIFDSPNEFPKLYAFIDKRKKNSSFNEFQRTLRNNLFDILANIKKCIKKGIQSVKLPSNNDNVVWIIAVIIFLIAAGGFVWLWKKEKIVKILKRQNNQLVEEENKKLEEKIKEQDKKKIEQTQTTHLHRRTKDESEPSQYQKEERQQQVSHSEIEPLKMEIAKPSTVYFPNPTKDETFNASYGHSTYEAGKSIYKFTIAPDGNTATFEIAPAHDSIRSAINQIDSRIEPACESENNYKQQNNLKTIKVGKAKLEGGHWKITQKAVIRYV